MSKYEAVLKLVDTWERVGDQVFLLQSSISNILSRAQSSARMAASLLLLTIVA